MGRHRGDDLEPARGTAAEGRAMAARRPLSPSSMSGTATSTPAKPAGEDAAEVTIGTDAAYAATAVAPWDPARPLRNVSEVRHFLRTNDVPIYFVGATPFNLLGLDRWIRNFTLRHLLRRVGRRAPAGVHPRDKPYVEFSSGEEINNWLLENAEVRAFIDGRRRAGRGPRSPWCSSTRRPSGSATSSATT